MGIILLHGGICAGEKGSVADVGVTSADDGAGLGEDVPCGRAMFGCLTEEETEFFEARCEGVFG